MSWYSFFHFLSKWTMRILFREKIKGIENIPLKGPLIIAPNHVSYLDPMAIGAFVPRKLHYVGREELFKNALFARLLRSCQCIPIKKGRPSKATIGKLLRILRQGEALLIFPEGTRSPTGELQGADQGIGFLALSTGATIIPAFVEGTDKALPPGSCRVRLNPVRARFGKPILAEEFSLQKDPRARRQMVADTVMKAIAELKHEL